MSDKKNVLSDSQKFKLANWLVANQGKGFSRSSATWEAVCDLGFEVTYSNMESAERATGISLVKAKEPKAGNDEIRISTLELEMSSVQSQVSELTRRMADFKEWCKVPINEKLAEAYIKPGANKPVFCHKHR